MIDLEKELEKYREVVKENPNLLRYLMKFNRLEKLKFFVLMNLIDNLEEKVKDKYRKSHRLVFNCLEDFKYGCYKEKADGSIKIYNPKLFYRRLGNINPILRFIMNTDLRELNFKRGFNKDAKNFVANVYKIIYGAYLKEYAEKRTTAH